MSKGEVDRVSMLLPKLGLANQLGHSLLNLRTWILGAGRTEFQFEVEATGTEGET
jgi:hypothetical protein